MSPGSTDSEASTGAVIGIDLGMTSVVAAHVDRTDEPPQVIPSERGGSGLAAVVAFRDPAAPIVGRAAQDMLTTAPSRTVTGIKRILGRKTTSQAVRDLNTRVGYEIVEGEGGAAVVDVDGRKITGPEVAALLLSEVRRLAETHLKQTVERCVVAVPAYFSADQKAAVQEAGRLANLDVVRLVHEPTAVALAYGYNKTGDARIVIIDMGGVRLDISVMEITGNVFDVVATGGDAYLGGANLDARLAEWILRNIEKKFGKDLREEPRLLLKVRTAAEQAKRELSRFKAVDLQIPIALVPRGEKAEIAQLRLTRETVEQLAGDLVTRVSDLVQHVLKGRGLAVGDVDDVILVGGGTRTLLLRQRITELFGKEPRSSLPPEQVIALGAALLAESLNRVAQAPVDVVELPIGIALSDGRFMKIIDKDSKLPITRRVMIPTTRENQQVVEIDLFQGGTDELLDNDYLGTVVYPDVPEAKAGDAKLVVDLVLGEDRLLQVTSPEDGRGGQRFEFKTRGHTDRPADNEDEPEPVFVVAQRVEGRPT